MTDDTPVTIPAWAAEEAVDELERAIRHTGGDAVDADEANTPLAEVRDRVVHAPPSLSKEGQEFVLDAIDGIAEARGVDASGADPLVDRTFRARQQLDGALDGVAGTATLAFEDAEFPEAVLAGRKWRTFRLDRPPVRPGDTLRMTYDGEAFATAEIEFVREALPWRLTSCDGHRGYRDTDSLLADLRKYYPNADVDRETVLTDVVWDPASVTEVDDGE